MKKLGLTGGIGSGKSVVADLLRVFGMPVYDSDRRAKELCVTDPDLRLGLVRLFGPEVYLDGGALNRTLMASRVFADAALLQASNALIHPAVIADFLRWAQRQPTPWVAQESAILFEAGLEAHFDAIVCVTAPEPVRIQRVCARSGLSVEAVQSRLQHQMAEGERADRSDFVLINDGNTALIPQVRLLLETLARYTN